MAYSRISAARWRAGPIFEHPNPGAGSNSPGTLEVVISNSPEPNPPFRTREPLYFWASSRLGESGHINSKHAIPNPPNKTGHASLELPRPTWSTEIGRDHWKR